MQVGDRTILQCTYRCASGHNNIYNYQDDSVENTIRFTLLVAFRQRFPDLLCPQALDTI